MDYAQLMNAIRATMEELTDAQKEHIGKGVCWTPNGNREYTIIRGETFEGQEIHGIQCFGIEFHDCVFRHCHFSDNQYEYLITVENCRFEDTVFEENWINIQLNDWKCNYVRCRFADLAIQSFQEQSTVSSRSFEDCVFENVRIAADITFQPNRMARCRFTNCDLYMNCMNECQCKDTSFESVAFKCALLSNRFERVRFVQCGLSPEQGCAHGNYCVECERDGETFVTEDMSSEKFKFVV